jgi:hypothetical protein
LLRKNKNPPETLRIGALCAACIGSQSTMVGS